MAGMAGRGMEKVMEPAKLRKLRKSLDLSVADAARQVEVNPRTWQRWESGDRAIPRGTVKLFRILNGLDEPEQ